MYHDRHLGAVARMSFSVNLMQLYTYACIRWQDTRRSPVTVLLKLSTL